MKRIFITVFLTFLTVVGPAQTVRKRNAVAAGYSPASTSAIAGLRFGF